MITIPTLSDLVRDEWKILDTENDIDEETGHHTLRISLGIIDSEYVIVSFTQGTIEFNDNGKPYIYSPDGQRGMYIQWNDEEDEEDLDIVDYDTLSLFTKKYLTNLLSLYDK